MSEPKKQFICGATCPACNEIDKIQMWYEDGVPHRKCVACGYTDKLDADGQSIPLGTGSDASETHDTHTQNILIVSDSGPKQPD
ncbi:YheV family putative zinc ribbon protein [Pseudomonas extremaustralis]|nr:YheV family putative zinc ribbon protein [Pseudomonas extremaustralis]MDB1111310.1 YheV family putative zinc ribbon protein [Pseudomonas extremaustralis]